MKTVIKIVIIACIFGGVLFGSNKVTHHFYQKYETVYIQWIQENQCINDLVKHGVQRNLIERDNGSCYIKESQK